MKCPNCGQEITGNFCSACGSPASTAAPTSTTIPTPAPASLIPTPALAARPPLLPNYQKQKQYKKAMLVLTFLIIFLSLGCGLSFIVGLNNQIDEVAHDNLVAAIVMLVIDVALIIAYLMVLRQTKKIEKQAQAAKQAQMDSMRDMLGQLQSAKKSDLAPICYPHNVFLANGETCYLQWPAAFSETKEKTVGHRYTSSGTRVRIAPGVSIGGSSGRSTPIKRDVTTYYHGWLSVTDMRLVMSSQKGAFDAQLAKISSITPSYNGLMVQVGAKQYTLQMAAPELVLEYIRIMREALPPPASKKRTSKT